MQNNNSLEDARDSIIQRINNLLEQHKKIDNEIVLIRAELAGFDHARKIMQPERMDKPHLDLGKHHAISVAEQERAMRDRMPADAEGRN